MRIGGMMQMNIKNFKRNIGGIVLHMWVRGIWANLKELGYGG